jgi:acyl dehydratase
MSKRLVSLGVGLLVLAAALAVVSYGTPTPIKTGSLYPDASPGMVGCYTSGASGELVEDPAAGTAIVDGFSHQRAPVTWPTTWSARRTLLGVEVIDERGQIVARTGTYVNLSGGYWHDGSFLACTVY